ncbi:MAG: ATP-binding cassette domain-containing protein [Pseudomonadota bacterium]
MAADATRKNLSRALRAAVPASLAASLGLDAATTTTTPSALPAGLPLPAAMCRLARALDIDASADEAATTAQYGEKPGRASVHLLAEDLGADIRIAKRDVAALTAEDAPCIVICKGASALIVLRIDGETAVVDGAAGRARLSLAALAAGAAGAVLAFNVDEARTAQFVNTPAIADDHAPQDNPGDDVVAWLVNRVLKRHRPAFTQLLLAAGLTNLFLVCLPLFIMSVYDRVIPHSAFESLQTLTVGILIVLVADLGLRYARLKFVDAIGLTIARDLQLDLYRRLLNSRLDKKPKSAAAISNLQGELETVCLLTPEFMAGCVADAAFAFVVFALIASIGGLVVLAPLAGAAAVVATIIIGEARARKDVKAATALRGAGVAQIGESYDALTAIKATGAEHALMARFEKLADVVAAKGHAARHRTRFTQQATAVIIQATIVGTLALGALRIDAGLMSIGSLAATTILVGRAVTPLGALTDQFTKLRSLREILRGAFALVGDGEEDGGDAQAGPRRAIKGVVSLRGASVRFDEDAAPALDGVSIAVRPGEKIGVVGKNGSGKSTFLQLFPRLLTPSGGAMLIDGADARQFSPRRIRQLAAFMPQDSVLFNDTLYANIAIGPTDFSEEDFERAVRAAGVDRFAARHPKGFSLVAGPRGEHLSAGERQAVALARTLLRPRPVLVLDEPTAMMDHTAEGHVIEALRRHVEGRTLIVSTHRMRLLDLVDRLIALESGRVIADGPKDAVLKALAAGPAAAAPPATHATPATPATPARRSA